MPIEFFPPNGGRLTDVVTFRRFAELESASSMAYLAGHASRRQADSLFHWGVKCALDLHDGIVEQALDLDHGTGWIWRLAPEFLLRLVDHGRETVQVTDVNGKPHAILQAGALRLGDQADIEECPANSGLGGLHQGVGRRIDAEHTGDKDEVAGPRAETPGALRLDGTGGLSVLTPFGDGDCG